MAAHQNSALVTVDNLNASEIDIENQARGAQVRAESQEEAVINIGEFVFNHITAET